MGDVTGLKELSKFLGGAILVFGLVGAAQSADLPKYEIAKHCQATLQLFADKSVRQTLLSGCIELEENSKAQANRIISDFKESTIRTCDALASAQTGGSYQVFTGCLALDVARRYLDGELEMSSKKTREHDQ